MNTGAGRLIRKIIVNTKEYLKLTDTRNFTLRQLFYEDTSTCPANTIVEIVVEETNTIKRCVPKFSNTLPSHSAFWGHEMYPFTAPTYQTRALKIWSSRNVIVCGNKGGLLFEDGTYDWSSFGFFKWDATDLSPKTIVPKELLYDVRKATLVNFPVFLGFNGGHTNYSHWLTDHVTILDIYIEYFQSKGVKIALPDNLTAFARDSVKLMGIEEGDILWLSKRPVQFSDLRFASTFAFNEIPLRFNQAIDRLLAGVDFGGIAQSGAKRIFISRRDATSRPFLNEKALEAMMAQLGYEIVVTGNMSLLEQIHCFREAEIVVGAHGAGLINSIFCKPGATLVEIFPEYMVQPHFWTTASLRGLNYGCVSGTSFDPDSASVTAAHAWASASIAPLAQLKLALSGL